MTLGSRVRLARIIGVAGPDLRSVRGKVGTVLKTQSRHDGTVRKKSQEYVPEDEKAWRLPAAS